MMRARILLVDDHTLMRAGIRSLLDDSLEFEVVAEAHSVDGALAASESAPPDIVVTDLSLNGESGLDLLRAIRQRWPAMPVLVLSMHAAESYVSGAFSAGASGYVVKDAAPCELVSALQCVQRGESYLSPALSGKMVRWSVGAPGTGCAGLTARQRQILGRIGAGKSTKQIAFELGLSEKTVAAHRAQVMDRLGIRDRVGLALFALEQGIVQTG